MPILQRGADDLLTKDKNSAVYKMMHGLEWKRKKSTKPKTIPQLTQQLRFSVANAFTKQVRSIVDLGYTKRKPALSPQNMFTSAILKNGILGEYPDYWIDYSKVKLSNGALNGMDVTEFVFSSPEQLTLSWNTDTIDIYFVGNTLVNALVYCERQNVFLPFLRIANFWDATVGLKLPPALCAETIICWTFLISDDGRNSGKTIYLGELKYN